MRLPGSRQIAISLFLFGLFLWNERALFAGEPLPSWSCLDDVHDTELPPIEIIAISHQEDREPIKNLLIQTGSEHGFDVALDSLVADDASYLEYWAHFFGVQVESVRGGLFGLEDPVVYAAAIQLTQLFKCTKPDYFLNEKKRHPELDDETIGIRSTMRLAITHLALSTVAKQAWKKVPQKFLDDFDDEASIKQGLTPAASDNADKVAMLIDKRERIKRLFIHAAETEKVDENFSKSLEKDLASLEPEALHDFSGYAGFQSMLGQLVQQLFLMGEALRVYEAETIDWKKYREMLDRPLDVSDLREALTRWSDAMLAITAKLRIRVFNERVAKVYCDARRQWIPLKVLVSRGLAVPLEEQIKKSTTTRIHIQQATLLH
jgi:hypothetical protein